VKKNPVILKSNAIYEKDFFLDTFKGLKATVEMLLFTSQPMDSAFIKLSLTTKRESAIYEA